MNVGRTSMKRRTRWILCLGVGIPLILIGAAVVILLLLDHDPDAVLSSIDVKELPSDWTPEAPAPSDDSETTEPAIAPPTIESIDLPVSGTLVITGDGEPFGEERYTFSLGEGAVVLNSMGEFWFKALIARITISFEQSLEMDRLLRPHRLTASFDGPFGFERELRADVGASSVTVISGGEIRRIDLQRDDIFVVNTFSTYALVPLLFELRQPSTRIDCEMLLLAGSPSAENDENAASLPEMHVERSTDGIIRYQGRNLIVSRYIISGDTGEMILYARGIELVGIYAGGEEGSLFVYRADYFDGGFDVPADDLAGTDVEG
jgi:hypothetical protein